VSNKTTAENLLNYDLPAVILAAGEGHRLHEGNGGIPKPLTPVLGKTLLERTILSCRKAGIKRVYVVVGCYEREVTNFIEQLKQEIDISIHIVRNPHWKEGNGTSVLAVSPHIDSTFMLMMCDHLFDSSILNSLIETQNGANNCLLAVDNHIDNIFDICDATKVQLNNQKITAIGKDISPFNAIDTGFFLFQPIVFDALKMARREGDGSLTAGIRKLIRLGKIKAIEIGNRFWFDVDTPACLSQAKRILLSTFSKPKEDGFISRFINRPISLRMSKFFLHTQITPNMITVLSFLICLVSAYLFGFGEYSWTFLAGVLVQLSSIVDGCDGEIARLKFQSTHFGAWFDTILDRYADIAVAVGITYGFWQAHYNPLVLLGGVMALSGFIMSSYTKKEYELCYKGSLPNTILNKLIKRDTRLFTIFLGALFNKPFEAMIFIGALSHFGVGINFYSVFRQRKK